MRRPNNFVGLPIDRGGNCQPKMTRSISSAIASEFHLKSRKSKDREMSVSIFALFRSTDLRKWQRSRVCQNCWRSPPSIGSCLIITVVNPIVSFCQTDGGLGDCKLIQVGLQGFGLTLAQTRQVQYVLYFFIRSVSYNFLS